MPEARNVGSRTIPDGLALVLSDRHPGGFDGRYFGLVLIATLQKVEPVLWTPKENDMDKIIRRRRPMWWTPSMELLISVFQSILTWRTSWALFEETAVGLDDLDDPEDAVEAGHGR